MLINIDHKLANCLRFLSVDAINEAQSGHPGMPLGLADVMTVLFREFLRHSPEHPHWHNRDRVVLSNGHGSMLLYAALYLSGYDWHLDELKQFRQKGSEAAGHPEFNVDKGIEVTTGPLGQGLANACGMAIAKERLAELHGKDVFNYRTFCFVGDGCLMEGISHEVASLIPKLVRSGLIVIWDDNEISIDGKTDPWFEQDVKSRFRSYGFKVIEDVDGHDFDQIRVALQQATTYEGPCFIQMKTTIGKGCAMVEGHAKAHGQPLSAEALGLMRKSLEWPYPPFEIPQYLKEAWDCKAAGRKNHTHWTWPQDVQVSEHLYAWLDQQPLTAMATRKSSSLVLDEIAKIDVHFIGGSADLKASNLTGLSTSEDINGLNFQGQTIAFGVREFGMFAIANGLALSGLTPFVATFLTFVDYGRNALRMAALMRLRVIYILTHDSILLGEDGPTHQPVEHLTMCRATPNVYLWRPCNLQETVAAWVDALQRSGPTVLALSRQKIAEISHKQMKEVAGGAYIYLQVEKPQITLMASGSEVEIAIKVAEHLAGELSVEVVSVPCLDLLNEMEQPERVVRCKREACFVIEASSQYSWHKWVPSDNAITVDNFGFSGKISDLREGFGLTFDQVVDKLRKQWACIK